MDRYYRPLENRLASNEIYEALLEMERKDPLPKPNPLLFCEKIYTCDYKEMDCLYGKKDCYSH